MGKRSLSVSDNVSHSFLRDLYHLLTSSQPWQVQQAFFLIYTLKKGLPNFFILLTIDSQQCIH